jgi:hypothetical protein
MSSTDICELFYLASNEFSEAYIKMIGNQNIPRKVIAISVKIDFNRAGTDEMYRDKKVKRTFKAI